MKFTVTSLAACLKAAHDGNCIPVALRIPNMASSALEVFEYLQAKGRCNCFLEAIASNTSGKQFSYIAVDSVASITTTSGETVVVDHGMEETVESPFVALKALLAKYHYACVEDDLPPFSGGAIGTIAYDSVHYLEPIDMPERGITNTEAALVFPKTLIAFDHAANTCFLIGMIMAEKAEAVHEQHDAICEELEALAEEICAIEIDGGEFEVPEIGKEEMPADMQASMGELEFRKAFEKIKRGIKDGDVYQCVLADCFHFPVTAHPLKVYKTLRALNPSPYMFYLGHGTGTLLGTSPELLLQVKDGVIENYPIAGTRPRGADEAEDKELEADLLADVKEKAEHTMLVDLARNDVGRVAEAGSVTVPKLMQVDRFSHVMHLSSLVSGKLRGDLSAVDAFGASFPAGTLSGSPKIRAMQFISALEKHRRGCYGGAVMFAGYNGNLTAAITIRSVFVNNGKGYVQAGAGIVADSVVENEYQEIRNKAKACLSACAASMKKN